MANVLWYYSSIHDLGCGCCSERVVEYELRDESGKVLEWSDNGPVVYDAADLKESFAYLVERHGEFEAHSDNVYL
jgi:hypothetical protein